jgi:hypothetical protein
VHSHPNYHNDGPWYEWVLVQFEESHGSTLPDNARPGTTPPSLFPSKVLAIFKDPNAGQGGGVCCLVHCCGASNHTVDTRLTETW